MILVGAGYLVSISEQYDYVMNSDNGVLRRFDGIGAISGGGATSKLLRNYPEKQRNEILDFLFKPGFGASLQILKVEIGGDSQSTDGVESSHMHTEDEANYHRGYEWWLMTEAKKRNAHIRLYGLPWVFPGWLRQGGTRWSPYANRTKLVNYIIGWLDGAQICHNLTIDYIGVWNERPYDIQYIKMLRSALDSQGYAHVKIVAPDSASWQFVDDFLKDPELAQAVDIIGIHYPGSYSPGTALRTDRPLWASEDFSCQNDIAGGGCWARVLNEGFVGGFFTGSLMTANQPWSGHYEVMSPIWMTAHHTQFMEIGWRHLPHGHGAGRLSGNGTYVAVTSPDSCHLTVVIETMDPQDAPCFYPMPKYTVAQEQQATFKLKGSYKKIKELNVWYSHLKFDGQPSVLFKKLQALQVVNSSFSLIVRRNTVYTLTTLATGIKGSYPPPPAPEPFPVPYREDFEGYPESAEPYNFAQQAGSFEVTKSGSGGHGKVMTQVVPEPPIDTCRPQRMTRPIAVLGNPSWSDISIGVDVYIDKPPEGATGVFIAAQVPSGGCDVMYADGVYFWVSPGVQQVAVTGNYSKSSIYKVKSHHLAYQKWYRMVLHVQGRHVEATLDGSTVFSFEIPHMQVSRGYAAVGTETFARAHFDNFVITDPKTTGMNIVEKIRENWTSKLRDIKKNRNIETTDLYSREDHLVSETRRSFGDPLKMTQAKGHERVLKAPSS
ncbi:Galactocerebrosidase [Lamellibrachia satsuma]|nr:Galactocerebrosidase [Lamellibrachia satsuma]